VSKYQFIDTEKANRTPDGGTTGYPISLLCKVLGVPESSYYDWNSSGRTNHQNRAAEAAAVTEQIRRVHAESDSSYGASRVRGELRNGGIVISKRRVAELMAAGGIKGLSGREHSTGTTRRDRMAAPFPDLVNRQFHPATPDTCWYGDITYLWVDNRFWYLATVIDAATKEVIGWRLADHMETSLVADALLAAVARRNTNVAGVIFHTDRGAQYTSKDFTRLCRSLRIRQSMGRTGVCFDNAAAESFFSTFKRELIDRYHWDDPECLRVDIFQWIETWYNRKRLHTTIGMRTPHQAYTDYTNRRTA